MHTWHGGFGMFLEGFEGSEGPEPTLCHISPPREQLKATAKRKNKKSVTVGSLNSDVYRTEQP